MARRFPARRWSASASRSTSQTRSRATVKTQSSTQNIETFPANIGCLLIPQFPVWAARYVHPELKSKPLLIHRRGIVMAACQQSLGAGVNVDWTLQRAQSLYPEAIARAFDPNEEAFVWEEVLSSLYSLTPKIESKRPGLLFFEAPAPKSTEWLSTMAAVAKLVREWNAHAAIACDRATAEIAAHSVAAGVIRRIGNAPSFLSRVSTAALTAVGLSEYSAERLQWFGFKTVADLSRLTRSQIASQFSDATYRNDSSILWRYARAGTPNADCQPIQSYQLPAIKKSRVVFEQPATTQGEWENALWDIVQQAAAQLAGMSAGAIAVCIETSRGTRHESKLLRDTTSSPRTLNRVAKELVSGALQSGEELQVLEVRLTRLTAAPKQNTLFDTRRHNINAKRELPPLLLRALSNLEARQAGAMWHWRLRDEHAALTEDRYSLIPALNEST